MFFNISGMINKKHSRRDESMALAQVKKKHEITYTLSDAMDALLMKLDEAIDDMENGRVQDLDEAWKETDPI